MIFLGRCPFVIKSDLLIQERQVTKNNVFMCLKESFCLFTMCATKVRYYGRGVAPNERCMTLTHQVYLCLRHAHTPAWCQSMSLSLSRSFSHHPTATYQSSPLYSLCKRKRERAVKAKDRWWWIMCANLSGSILFPVTGTQCSCASSYICSSPYLPCRLQRSFSFSKYPSNLHSSFICSSSIYPSIHASIPPLAWQWCRAEKLWIIHQAGLFFPSPLPTFGSLWRWGTFGDAHATHTCTFTKDTINSLHSWIDCSMHVCLCNTL